LSISDAPTVIDLPMARDRAALVVVETPSGSGNKLKFDTELQAFLLDRVLPVGMTFPFDFGFVPQTLADDGDPLDAIVLLDAPVYPGCIVPARLVGVIEAEQHDEGKPWERNDRLLAVATASKTHRGIRSIRDLDGTLVDAIGAFFEDYHRLSGASFRVIGQGGAQAAARAVRQSHRRFAKDGAKAPAGDQA
jgi:inorganic pyrophosphatase